MEKSEIVARLKVILRLVGQIAAVVRGLITDLGSDPDSNVGGPDA